ncbi:MAG: DUF368 domain-containing protein [Haloarculaceae archaeon]
MGAADSVPGVSGGTIAFITGIYERLIAAITGIDVALIATLPRLHTAAGRTAFRERLVRMDAAFLVVLGTGVVSAVVLVSRVVQAALAAAPAPTYAFFFGLIAASAVVLYGEVSLGTPGRLAAAAVGFALAFVVSGVTQATGLGHSVAFVFAAGAVAITAMILPGISGAFFLLLLGQYDYLTATLTIFTDGLVALADGASLGRLVEPGVTIAAFAAGALVGLLTIAHVIRWALTEHRAATLAFLVSLMVGALRLPIAEVLANTTAWTTAAAVVVVAAALAGAGVVLLLDHYTDDLEYGA